MAESLKDYHNTGDSYTSSSTNTSFVAQTFTASSDYKLSTVKLKIRKGSTNPGDITVELQATSSGTPTGTALATSDAVSGLTLTTSLAWYSFGFSSEYSIVSGTEYALVLKASLSSPVYWGLEIPGTYSDGQAWQYSGSWTGQSTWDFMFEVWGEPLADYTDLTGTFGITVGLTGGLSVSTAVDLAGTFDISVGLSGELIVPGVPTGGVGSGGSTRVRLIAIGNDCVYYESS